MAATVRHCRPNRATIRSRIPCRMMTRRRTPSAAYRIAPWWIVIPSPSQMPGVTALCPKGPKSAQPEAGKGAADHQLVVAAPRAVRVEVLMPTPVGLQKLTRR